jgi:large subunit ribosomal protein L46
VYNAYGKERWNDEVLVGAKESEPEEVVEALLRDAVVQEEESGGEAAAESRRARAKVERPQSRWTEADEKGDTRSLNRALMRTLYLVVKRGEKGLWEFPSGGLEGGESLHRVWRDAISID